MERRKQAAEELKASRERAKAEASTHEVEDTSILDNLLEKLRNGDSVGRKRRTRNSERRPAAPLELSAESLLVSGTGNDTADLARDMLARLKSDGFDAITPTSPTSSTAPRRSRRRAASTTAFKGIVEELEGSTLDGTLLEGEASSISVSELGGESMTEMDTMVASESSDTIETVKLETPPGADPVSS